MNGAAAGANIDPRPLYVIDDFVYQDMDKGEDEFNNLDVDEVESITTPDETDAPAPPAAPETPVEPAPAEPTKPAQSGTPVEGVVSEIRSAVIGGNTVYYLRLTGDTHYYSISAADSEQAVILNVGDTIRAETLGGCAIQKLASLTITGE